MMVYDWDPKNPKKLMDEIRPVVTEKQEFERWNSKQTLSFPFSDYQVSHATNGFFFEIKESSTSRRTSVGRILKEMMPVITVKKNSLNLQLKHHQQLFPWSSNYQKSDASIRIRDFYIKMSSTLFIFFANLMENVPFVVSQKLDDKYKIKSKLIPILDFPDP